MVPGAAGFDMYTARMDGWMAETSPRIKVWRPKKVGESWKRFKKKWFFYMTTVDGNTISNARKEVLLVTVAGAEALDIYYTHTHTS